MASIYEKLQKVQAELKAPKGQYNSFGGYHYRSCEDIVEAVKPHLQAVGAALMLSDELVLIGSRYYIKATATLAAAEGNVSVTAYAREEESKKGMDGSQITGTASSYARKYALNGLFAIDDTKDADATQGQGEPRQQPTPMQGRKPESGRATQPQRQTRAPSERGNAPPAHDVICIECGCKLNQRELDYSMRAYGVPLCRTCQNKLSREGRL